MARKNAMKNDSITFNSRTKAVMADVVQDNIKEKVNAVREVVSGKSNNEIILVLQYYDYDVAKTIQAYVDDGAKSALTEWHYSGTKPPKKKRSKKKNAGVQQDAPKSPESVSSESGSMASVLVNGETPKEPSVNGLLPFDVSGTEFFQCGAVLSKPAVEKPLLNGTHSTSTLNGTGPSPHPTPDMPNTCTDNGYAEGNVNGTKEKSPTPQPQRQQRQRTHSGSHGQLHAEKKHAQAEARHRTSSTSSVGDSGKKHAHGLERSSKDLHRQTVSLERLKLVFNEEIEKTYKRVKTVFDELRSCLNAREGELNREVDSLRDTGRDIFIMRQGLAADLKVKIDRAEKLSEEELTQLRADIKHFVSDRKIDEDLGRTTRFLYDDDLMKKEMKNFGEVVPVKCAYIQQYPQVPSPSEPNAEPHTEAPARTPPSNRDEKPDKSSQIPHLDKNEAHEMAELQRRLKKSLTLEGIEVETYPDRPASAPVQSSSVEKNSPSRRRPESGSQRNRNRRPPRGDTDRNRQDDSRGYNQAPSGERVILIGRGTRPQGGASRPPRGRRGRGGYGGRGRGGPRPDGQEAGSGDSSSQGGSLSPIKERTQQENPRGGSPRGRGSGNRRSGSSRGRDGSRTSSQVQSDVNTNSGSRSHVNEGAE